MKFGILPSNSNTQILSRLHNSIIRDGKILVFDFMESLNFELNSQYCSPQGRTILSFRNSQYKKAAVDGCRGRLFGFSSIFVMPTVVGHRSCMPPVGGIAAFLGILSATLGRKEKLRFRASLV